MTYLQRRENVIHDLRRANIDAVILTPSTDFSYLTGSARQPAQRPVTLILTLERSALVLPEFEQDNEPELARELELITYRDGDNPAALIAGLLKPHGRVAVGRDMRASLLLTLQRSRAGLEWVSADELLIPMRRRKDAQEAKTIEEAQHMAERALMRLIQQPLTGKTEREVSDRLRMLRLDEGFEAVGNGIVASGPNTALPHHINGDRVIQKGDTLMFDIGGLYHGYRADFTRTYAVGAMPERFDEIYAIVLEAHQAGKNAALPGVSAEAVDCAARNVIECAGYGSYFTHRLGHGIGMDVHEPPFIQLGNTETLEPGNVFSCEPGIYLPGRFGIRIEDLLVMEEVGARSLNSLSKALTVLPV